MLFKSGLFLVLVVAVSAFMSAAIAQSNAGTDTAATVYSTNTTEVTLTGYIRDGYLTFPAGAERPPHEPRSVGYCYLHLGKPIDLLGRNLNHDVLHQYDIQLLGNIPCLAGTKVTVRGLLPRPEGAYTGVPFRVTMLVQSVDP